MTYAPPRLGGALLDETPETPTAAAPVAGSEHLCNTCSRAPVCAVRAAVRVVGGEGLIVIGACSFHEEEPSDEDDD